MFGPVISLIEFDSEKDAIDLANDSEYGLGSGLFTKDLSRAHRVSKEIKAGICWINTYRVISPIAAFGGFNQSGYAREAGKQSILDYTRTKTTWINTSDEPMKNPFIMRYIAGYPRERPFTSLYYFMISERRGRRVILFMGQS